jgi:hypothetical protein
VTAASEKYEEGVAKRTLKRTLSGIAVRRYTGLKLPCFDSKTPATGYLPTSVIMVEQERPRQPLTLAEMESGSSASSKKSTRPKWLKPGEVWGGDNEDNPEIGNTVALRIKRWYRSLPVPNERQALRCNSLSAKITPRKLAFVLLATLTAYFFLYLVLPYAGARTKVSRPIPIYHASRPADSSRNSTFRDSRLPLTSRVHATRLQSLQCPLSDPQSSLITEHQTLWTLSMITSFATIQIAKSPAWTYTRPLRHCAQLVPTCLTQSLAVDVSASERHSRPAAATCAGSRQKRFARSSAASIRSS